MNPLRQQTRTRRFVLGAGAGLAIAALSTAAMAQNFPTRPILIVVPVQAATASDLVARVVAEKASAKLGQPVVVENVVGAGGALGATRVARANPDGYTLGLFNRGVHTVLPHLQPQLPFNPWKDFVPVTQLADVPSTLIANPKLGVKTLPELIALAKKSPGRLNYASVGNGSPQHIGMEHLMQEAGIEMTHVPYKGGATATAAIVSGEVDVFWIATSVSLGFIRNGQVRALAVGEKTRTTFLPDVPTVAEQGLPNYAYTGWFSLFAPSATPEPVLAILQKAIAEVLADPEVIARLADGGMTARSSTGAHVNDLLTEEEKRVRPVLRRIGLIKN